MNSNRMLGLTQGSQAKSTEKLSSGYKINRAADDAAGLAISEKMRKQIRGLTQASSNAQDGISAVQTAEGALNEVQDMLQRMNELAVKAANGTNSESDRSAIQDEINQLTTEIDRVSTTTKFNETYLLKGVNATTAKTGELTYSTANTSIANETVDTNTGVVTKSVASAGTAATYSTAASDKTLYEKREVVFNNVSYTLIDASSVKSAGSSAPDALNASQLVAKLNDTASATKNTAGVQTNQYFTDIDSMMKAIRNDNAADIKNVSAVTDTTTKNQTIKVETFADLNNAADLSLHVGADSTADNKISMNVGNLSARGLGVNGLKVNGETPDNATKAIDTISAALQQVSNQRAALGAIQNRLEHTINNLDNVVENTTSAESAIRDTDMATEMVKYSNNNILSQAGQAMLAQANQSNQGVLSLLG
jgi:flagellin